MNELLIHLRKDIKVISSSALVILFILIISVSILASLNSANSYSQQISNFGDRIGPASQQEMLKDNLLAYWKSVIVVSSIISMIVFSSLMAQEKESGMLGYTLTFRPRTSTMFASILVLSIMIALALVLTSLIIYCFVFVISGLSLPDNESVVMSLLFPISILIIFSLLGTIIALLISKKNTSIIVSVAVFFILMLSSTYAFNFGSNENLQTNGGMIGAPNPDNFSILSKSIIMINPQSLNEGTVHLLNLSNDYVKGNINSDHFTYLSLDQDIILAILYIASLTLLGWIIFNRNNLNRVGRNEK